MNIDIKIYNLILKKIKNFMVILIRKVIVFLCAKFHTQNDKYFDADVIIFNLSH